MLAFHDLLHCPTCQTPIEGDAQFCPRDGTPLAPLAAPMAIDPLVGRLLGGRYRLVARLGQGGMGTVYRAIHAFMDKPVAVKVLRGDLTGDPEASLRFHREARSASRLDHEHCIRVTDFGQSDDGLLYLVMELLDGESLGQLVARGPIEPRKAATLATAIADALAHAHEHGIVHRDLKPDNVFLAHRRGKHVVKVLDFGLAKIAGDGPGGPSITKAGVIFGTPEYMAPEQAQGEALDARTDIYALGVILYQMLAGELPFRATSFLALLAKQVQEVPVPPSEKRPELGIPDGLEAVALRCMEKDPSLRYQTADEVSRALLPWAEAASPSGVISLGDLPSSPGERDATPARRPVATPRSGELLPSGVGDAPVSETPSVLSGEVLPRRGLGRGIAIGLVGLVLVGGVVFAVAATRHTTRPDTKPPEVKPTPAVVTRPVDPLVEANRLLDAEDLEGAERVLRRERAARDGLEIQLLLGELEQRQGNRLGAMAHFYRASRLAPANAEPHARLASLLALLGQRESACREARAALERDPKNAMARAAAQTASCREKP